MSTYVSLYTNNPTAGKKDGTAISEGTQLSPISVTVDTAKNEEKVVKCAIRYVDGYDSNGVTTIQSYIYNKADGTYSPADKYCKLAKDNNFTEETALKNATWENKLTFNEVISDTNIIFWVKINTNESERPQKDTSIVLQYASIVEAEV